MLCWSLLRNGSAVLATADVVTAKELRYCIVHKGALVVALDVMLLTENVG